MTVLLKHKLSWFLKSAKHFTNILQILLFGNTEGNYYEMPGSDVLFFLIISWKELI